jgi:MFS family permease
MLRLPTMPTGNRRIFITLFMAILTSVTGVGIVVPLLPVYARHLGASGLYVGLIFGAFSLSRSVFLPCFGRLSDRRGRKPFIIAGLMGYVAVSVAFMAFKSVDALIIVRFLQGIASAMIMPVAQAYVGDITPTGGEGFSMGLFNMSVFLGLSLGPLLGGFISESYSLQLAFAVMGALALLGCLTAMMWLPSSGGEQVRLRKKAPIGWKYLITDKDIPSLFAFRFAYTTCIGILWGFLPVYADGRFSLPASDIGILLMLGVFSSGAIHVPMGVVADRFSKNSLVIIGGLMIMTAMASFYWAWGFWDLAGACLVFGLGGGVAMPALMALAVISGNRAGAMGSVMALLTMAHSLGMLSGAMLAGLIMDVSRLRLVFLWGAAIIGLGALVFCCRMLHGRPRRTPPESRMGEA